MDTVENNYMDYCINNKFSNLCFLCFSVLNKFIVYIVLGDVDGDGGIVGDVVGDGGGSFVADGGIPFVVMEVDTMEIWLRIIWRKRR